LTSGLLDVSPSTHDHFGRHDGQVRVGARALHPPDVAAVKVRQVYQTPDGPDVGTPLWVMTKEDGQSLLTACQNTGVLEDELVAGAESGPVFSQSK
jgi:hypothetical protein